jgi:hypothetical protein
MRCDENAGLKEGSVSREDNLLLVDGVRTGYTGDMGKSDVVAAGSEGDLECRLSVTGLINSRQCIWKQWAMTYLGSNRLEKQVYGDLLTDELDCDDSYKLLASKTKEFFRFVTRYPKSEFVMIADDVYLRLIK